MPPLSTRTLNRTLLQRQLLLDRVAWPVDDVVGRLVAMQGQEPDAPYVGLWTRVTGFRHDALSSSLRERRIVRGAHLRTTQHLALAEDFRWLRPLLQPRLDRAPMAGLRREIDGVDLAELAAVARRTLAGKTLTRRELGVLLAERFPDRRPGPLAVSAHFLVAMVHPPPSGLWGRRGPVPCALAEDWIGRDLEQAPSVGTLVTRYLAAFGPADVKDVQAWSGLTRLREVVEELRPRLRVHRDEHGRELFDLPEAEPADPELPAPVRFLPAFDNLLLGHADRGRVIADAHRKLVCPGQATVKPTFLVDGFVSGVWAHRDGQLLVSPFRELPGCDLDEVGREAGRLAAFLAGDGTPPTVGFDNALVPEGR
ncbi:MULTISPECIES: winged helix DNA-binding domain-containing protein [Streptomyces]|uniref:Winged helix DNA-binding domain-containing protein n=1 Tax=Streptomyces doudnae TaxID=3075536 RepID=A0ABD5ENJ6_9ACTN|nr:MULTISPECIES: winged helix DNA-binding domain-containing protein [unclassified Streptomyces]MDT0436268.1 winged helix DNA-binding domain-containing protein [Streptomyces sp. DSM 41981]